MNKRVLFATALLATASIAMAAGQNNPQNPPPAPESQKMHPQKLPKSKDGLPMGFERLNLSDAQKNKIKAIMQQNRPEKPADHAQRSAQFEQKMQQRRAAEQQLLTSKMFNEQAARQMIAERKAERAELQRDHADHELQMLKQRHAIFQVLTPAQQKQFLEEQKKYLQPRGERGDKPEPKEPK